jgi:hypothetical protein
MLQNLLLLKNYFHVTISSYPKPYPAIILLVKRFRGSYYTGTVVYPRR